MTRDESLQWWISALSMRASRHPICECEKKVLDGIVEEMKSWSKVKKYRCCEHGEFEDVGHRGCCPVCLERSRENHRRGLPGSLPHHMYYDPLPEDQEAP
jgi:hypothetical protein